MYVIASSPVLPVSLAQSAPAPAAAAEVSGLAKRVSAYLARVVGALADYEDQLLFEDGFFAREEHFEAQIDNLRREFEQNKKAQVLFARADAVGLLIAQLVARQPAVAATVADLHSRRQQQFVFAASVLLTSSTAVATLKANPVLIERLWAFAERPAPLDSVQLQYWCRVAGVLLLRDCGGSVGHANEFASGLAPRMPKLLKHVYSDSVCTLVKCLLGLPIGSSNGAASSGAGSGSPGATTVPASQPLPLRMALSGENSILPACVGMLLSDSEGATNAAELLCCICGALVDRPDALELCSAFVQSFTPMLIRIFHAALTRGATGRVQALRVAAAALRMEWQCASLMEEAHACLPHDFLGGSSTTSPAELQRSKAPFARLLAPRLDALRTRLLSDKSLAQVKSAELFATLIETAPLWMHEAICACGLLEAAVVLFLSPDHNGGGRQDFVRHLLLRGLRAALSSNGSPSMHHAVIVTTDLPRKLLRALVSTRKDRSGKEYHKLLYLELATASEREPSIYEMLAASPKNCWAELGMAVAGTRVASPQSDAPESPTLSPSSQLPSPRPPSPAPAELIYIEEDLDGQDLHTPFDESAAADDDSANSPPPRRRRSGEAFVVPEEDDEAPTAALLPPSADAQRGLPGSLGGEAKEVEAEAVDAENIDPNSPEATNAKRSRLPYGRGCGTPRPLDTSASSVEASATQPMLPPAALASDAAAALPPAILPPPQSPPAPSRTLAPPQSPPPAAARNGTPRPAGGTPRPDASARAAPVVSSHSGTPRPDKEKGASSYHHHSSMIENGSPANSALDSHETSPLVSSPSASSPAAILGYVEDSTLRTSEDFSRDTPQPKLIRRAYLHRKAKERFGSLTPKSPTRSSSKGSDSPGKSPSSPGRGGLFSGGSLASFMGSPRGSPGSSPKRERERSASSPAAASPTAQQLLGAALGFNGGVRRLSDSLLGSPSRSPAAATDEEAAVVDEEAAEEVEDPGMQQLRSSVRSLCF